MNRRILGLLSFFVLGLAGASFTRAQTTVPSSSFADPQAADKANAHEDELYNDGTEALNNGDYDDAAGKFDQVVKLRGRKADAALYWKAYALNKAGNKSQALAGIAEFRKTYPKSTYQHQADVLEQEIRLSAGQTPNPDSISDEELRLLALQALMNSDPERALPLLDKVIHGNDSPKMKNKALFVLAQSNSEKAQDILLSLAKANNDPDLQKRAIRYIGMSGNSRNRTILKEIYTSSTDPSVKKAVFQGWLMSGDKEDVLAVAKQEKSPELRRDAIKYLGMMGGKSELRQIYKEAGDSETKEAVLTGMMMCGDAQGLAEIANAEKDPKVLDKAINILGMVGGSEGLATLTNIYNSRAEVETRKRVINALFLHGAGKEMVALARKETNPELKKALVQKMSLMSSPEITEYMMEILNK
jgi:HEAT repeat protein